MYTIINSYRLLLLQMFFENQLEVNQDKDIEEQVSKFYKEQEHSKFIESLLKTSLELYTFPTPKVPPSLKLYVYYLLCSLF